jgi:transcriptional regulator with XRE-family HTH domain
MVSYSSPARTTRPSVTIATAITGADLLAIRCARNWSQRELALALGLAPGTSRVGHWEAGRAAVPAEVAARALPLLVNAAADATPTHYRKHRESLLPDGETIRRLRLGRGWTSRQLGKYLWPRASVRSAEAMAIRLESGKSQASTEVRDNLARLISETDAG